MLEQTNKALSSSSSTQTTKSSYETAKCSSETPISSPETTRSSSFSNSSNANKLFFSPDSQSSTKGDPPAEMSPTEKMIAESMKILNSEIIRKSGAENAQKVPENLKKFVFHSVEINAPTNKEPKNLSEVRNNLKYFLITLFFLLYLN